MKIFAILLILTMAFSLPILLFNQDSFEFPQFYTKSEAQPPKLSASEQYQKELEQGLNAYKTAYSEELEAFRQDILEQWGEFKDSSATVWVSYEVSENVRRTVDYESAEVKIELLVNKGTLVSEARESLDKAVFRLMNTTEKDAYKTDVVANRVEQKLSKFSDVMQTAKMSDERLFSLDDLVALNISHDAHIKVWYKAREITVSSIIESLKADKNIVQVKFKIPHTIHKQALKYAAVVAAAAEKEKISDELIYAIMETESSFNPMAKSHIPAYGLMQIVPYTAGKDATDYLYGKAKILAPSFLYKPENNITIGAAYLHVLHYRYMRKVKNEQSRLYCAIAAYNTGATNVAKAFINQASFNKAVTEINKLTPQQVYQKLKNFLPQQEARNYVEKVSNRMKKYL